MVFIRGMLHCKVKMIALKQDFRNSRQVLTFLILKILNFFICVPVVTPVLQL